MNDLADFGLRFAGESVAVQILCVRAPLLHRSARNTRGKLQFELILLAAFRCLYCYHFACWFLTTFFADNIAVAEAAGFVLAGAGNRRSVDHARHSCNWTRFSFELAASCFRFLLFLLYKSPCSADARGKLNHECNLQSRILIRFSQSIATHRRLKFQWMTIAWSPSSSPLSRSASRSDSAKTSRTW